MVSWSARYPVSRKMYRQKDETVKNPSSYFAQWQLRLFWLRTWLSLLLENKIGILTLPISNKFWQFDFDFSFFVLFPCQLVFIPHITRLILSIGYFHGIVQHRDTFPVIKSL